MHGYRREESQHQPHTAWVPGPFSWGGEVWGQSLGSEVRGRWVEAGGAAAKAWDPLLRVSSGFKDGAASSQVTFFTLQKNHIFLTFTINLIDL